MLSKLIMLYWQDSGCFDVFDGVLPSLGCLVLLQLAATAYKCVCDLFTGCVHGEAEVISDVRSHSFWQLNLLLLPPVGPITVYKINSSVSVLLNELIVSEETLL